MDLVELMELTEEEDDILSAEQIPYDGKLRILALKMSEDSSDPIYVNAKQESADKIACWLMRSRLVYQFIKGQSDEQIDALIAKVRLRRNVDG